MSLLGSFLQKRSITDSSGLNPPSRWLVDMLGGQTRTKTGVRVNERNAMTLTAVFACVRVISEGVAVLPLPVYRRMPKGKERDRNHYLYDLLQLKPNPEMTSFSFRETLQAHLLLWGNAYAEIEYDGSGKAKHLWPLMPNKTKRYRDDNGKTRYQVQLPNGEVRNLYKEQVLHIPGLSLNGKDGLSPIGYAREAVGIGLATEEFGSKFFKNGTNIGGIAEHPGELTEQGSKNLRDSLNQTYAGLGNSHRLMLLEEGMKYQKIGIPPNDAQFLETRKFQTREIARFYNVRPHMIGDLDNATFSNIEHQGIEHVVHTLTPWLTRWEQNINLSLFTEKGRKRHFAEFVVDGLLRGDIKTRYEAYAIGRQWGFLSTDDIMEKENKNTLPNGEGNMYLVPMNMVPAKQAKLDAEGSQEGRAAHPERRKKEKRVTHTPRQMRSAQEKNKVADSYKPMFRDAEKRIIRREANDLKRALKEHLGKRSEGSFLSWLESYYDQFPEFVQRQMEPVIESLAKSIHTVVETELGQDIDSETELARFVRNYVDAFTARYIGSSLGQLRALIRDAEVEVDEELAEILETRIDEWEERRPDKVAMRETVQASNALAKVFYVFAGVTALRWVTMGSRSCSLCDELDGEVVSTQQNFVERGQELEGEDGNEMTVQKPCGHAPLHDGCQCQIVAEV